MLILLVEPDIILLEQYGRKLETRFDVWRTDSAQNALDLMDSETQADCIVMDFDLGKNNGVEFLHEIRSYDDWLEVPVVLLSSIPLSRMPTSKLRRYGVKKILYKPQTAPSDLLREVSRLGLEK